jgi:hypothetical protein
VRELTTAEVIDRLITRLGRTVKDGAEVFFTGGVTAVLHGWRTATVDVNLKVVPDTESILRAIVELKEALRVNIEFAAPDEFVPELPGWRERSLFIRKEGPVSFFHYDLYAQALAKIERGHAQDVLDVKRMLDDGLVEPAKLRALFDEVEPALYRFPAIDPPSFRRAVEEATPSAS